MTHNHTTAHYTMYLYVSSSTIQNPNDTIRLFDYKLIKLNVHCDQTWSTHQPLPPRTVDIMISETDTLALLYFPQIYVIQ